MADIGQAFISALGPVGRAKSIRLEFVPSIEKPLGGFGMAGPKAGLTSCKLSPNVRIAVRIKIDTHRGGFFLRARPEKC